MDAFASTELGLPYLRYTTIKFTVQKYIYLSVSKMHVSVIHRKSDMDYKIFNVRT